MSVLRTTFPAKSGFTMLGSPPSADITGKWQTNALSMACLSGLGSTCGALLIEMVSLIRSPALPR
ncbi:MAG: hypothetical protein LBC41_05745 [Clostridiales bacterium]|nr:hypothetical protein [Clostridiales bacterium]MDR2750143.1 hypothetical protein [Clostridiales bacterium]